MRLPEEKQDGLREGLEVVVPIDLVARVQMNVSEHLLVWMKKSRVEKTRARFER